MAGDRPEHRHNTNPGEDFSGTIKYLSCFSGKSNSCPVRNDTKFRLVSSFRIRSVYLGQSLNSQKLTLRRRIITGDRSLT
jgi:hypothetical protein